MMTAARVIAIICAGGIAALAGCRNTERWELFSREEPSARGPEGRRPDLAARLARSAPRDEREPIPRDPIPRELTLEQAVLLSLEYNRDLRVRRFSPSIAATFEEIERGVYDPELFARGEVFFDEAEEVSRATGDTFNVQREDAALSGGVRQRFPSGTGIELGVTTLRNTSNRTPDQQNIRAGLTLTQALLRGLDAGVNLARIHQAEMETIASLYELQGFIESLIFETETIYWRFALAERRIRIFEESLELANRQQAEVEQRIRIGVSSSTEAAATRAEVAQREQDLINARSELDVIRLRLFRLIAPSFQDEIDHALVATTDPAMEVEPITDLPERLELAVMARPELNEARLRLDHRRLETIITRNGVLPRLDLFITLGKSGYADSFSDAFRDVDGRSYDLRAGLELSYPLGNRIAEGRHEQSLLVRRQAAESVANLEQLVRLDVRLAAAEVERSRQQIAATAATRRLREESLRAQSERFRVGQSTSLLVAQAQRDLVESQINEVEALVDYRLARIALHFAEGSLLARRGLSLGDAVE